MDKIVAEYDLELKKFKGEIKEVQNSYLKAEKSGVQSATKVGNAFDKTASKIKSGTKGVGQSFNQLGGMATSLAATMGVAFGVQQVIAFGKASVEAFIDAEKNAQLLLFALKGNEGAQQRLLDQASTMQGKTIFDDDSIIQAQTFLATQGRNEAQIKKVIEAAVELSTVTGVDLQTAVQQLDGTFEGNIGKLGKLDNAFKGLTKEQLANGAAIDLVTQKYKGTAEAMGNTTAGQVAKLKNQFGELQETVGSQLVPMLNEYLGVLTAITELDVAKAGKIFDQSFGRQFEQILGTLENAGIITAKYIDTLTDFEKTQLKVANATDQELRAEFERLHAQTGITDEAWNKFVTDIKQAALDKTFDELSQSLEITEKQFDALVKITDKYGISARVASSQILSIKDATKGDLEKAFQDFNKTLGVSRKDWDDYIGKVKQIKPIHEEIAGSTEKIVGPFDKLQASLAAVSKTMLDYLVLGKDAVQLDRERFAIQSQINKVQEQYNALVNSHIPVQREKNELVKIDDGLTVGLTEKITKQTEATLANIMAVIMLNDANKDHTKDLEDLAKKWKETSDIAGALAELSGTISDALTNIFGEAAEKNIAFFGFQKALTIAEITLSSIQAIAGGIAKLASSNPLDAIAGVSSIIAGIGSLIGGLVQQVNSISAPPTPAFAEGTDRVTGGVRGVDSVHAMLMPDEAVIKARENMKMPGMAKAWNEGRLSDFVMSRWVVPALKAQEQQAKQDFAANLANSMFIQAEFDDARLNKTMSHGNNINFHGFKRLEKALSKRSNPWNIN